MEKLIQNLYNPNNKVTYSFFKELEEIFCKDNELYEYLDAFVEMLDDNNSYIRIREIIFISSNAK